MSAETASFGQAVANSVVGVGKVGAVVVVGAGEAVERVVEPALSVAEGCK